MSALVTLFHRITFRGQAAEKDAIQRRLMRMQREAR
jgi:hypothetical protein